MRPAAALLPLCLLTACAAEAKMAGPVHSPVEIVERPSAPLTRSLFARDPSGQLDEDALQKILAAPIEIALPARVGVLPVGTATDWRGPGPSAAVPAGAGAFVGALRGSQPFTLVTEVMAIPSGALGMEALREVAARYRLRYLVLYREVIARERRSNGWAAFYPTLLGAFFVPGQTLETHGYLEASLFDVKTGTLLFTVRRRVVRERRSNVWHQEDKLAGMEAGLAVDEAPHLAVDLRVATLRYQEAARVESSAKTAATSLAAQP
jgi:hypothetical protein